MSKAVDKITARVETTQVEVKQNKIEMSAEIEQIEASISGIIGQTKEASTSSYATVVAARPLVPCAIDLQSQEVRIYWQFRRCAKIHSIPGETEAELWK